jgi:hypothetical protein
MQNVWKGLVVGGLTGVIAGVALDAIAGASKRALAVGDQVREHAPDAGQWIHSVSDKAGEWIHDADVPDHVRSVAKQVKGSDAAGKVKEASSNAVTVAKKAVDTHRG